MENVLSQRVLRSLLFVPGNRSDWIQKAWQTGADAVILDLEDGVPELQKAHARKIIQTELAKAPRDAPPVLVRINSSSTLHWKDDLNEILSESVKAIVLPKCESSDEVRSVEKEVERVESGRSLSAGSLAFFLLIESARGLLEASRLAQTSARTAALVFGGEDFCLDMGIQRSVDAAEAELAYARSHIAVCARAHGCLAIDTIFADFNDTEGLVLAAKAAKRAGFSGKLAIHPRQVQPINSVFIPSEEEIREAQDILKVFREAECKGLGTAALGGKMIDRPIADRARRTLRQSGIES